MPLPRTYRLAAAEINGNLRAGPAREREEPIPHGTAPRPGAGSSGPGPARRLPLGREEFVEGAPCGIPEGLQLRSGAEDVPARRAQDLGIGRTESAAQVRGGGALGAQARGQDGPADRRQVQLQSVSAEPTVAPTTRPTEPSEPS